MNVKSDFYREVEERSGQNLKACYQCFKCTVGCPVASHMDVSPSSLIRLIQYGERQRVLKSSAIWLCVSCMNCGARCPNEVDMSVIMDSLREMSLEAGPVSEKRVVMLHEEFVRSIKLWGRLHEATFFIAYMGRSFDIVSNIVSGVKLILKGKIPFIPKPIKGVKNVRGLFKRVYEQKAGTKEGV